MDVINGVKNRGCKLKFILPGVGFHSPELQVVKDKITALHLEDTITLMPWVSHANCLEYVRKSQFYITTALYEGLPLAVIEAMSVGKAIVASNVVGNRDCVKDGVNGFLLPLEINAFADKIIELANNNSHREKMGEESRMIFLNDFFIDRRIGLLQEQYDKVFLRH